MFRASVVLLSFAISGIVHAEPKVEIRLRQLTEAQKKLISANQKIEKQKQDLAEKQKSTGDKSKNRNRTSSAQIDYSKYDRCPNGKSWDGCDHEGEKAEWLREQQNKGYGLQKNLNKIMDDFLKRQQQISDRLSNTAKKIETITAEKENYIVKNGQFTFDEEASPDPAKTVVWPGTSNSGITIGGLDIAQWKNDSLVKSWLTASGLSPAAVNALMAARNLKGKDAEDWIKQNPDIVQEIKPANQKQIFEAVYSWLEEDVKRIVAKPDVVKAYGKTDWDNANPVIKDLVIDLRFRGDYDTNSRKRIQKHISNNDLGSLAKELSDRSKWKNVPLGRFKGRKDFATGALTQNRARPSSNAARKPAAAAKGEPPRPPSSRDIL
jgi:hypothetical protein